MAETFYIGNFPRGQVTNLKGFNIDDKAFVTLFNMYVWRGQVRRKRGTSLLNVLQRQIVSVAAPTNPWELGPLVLVAGSGNLITGFSLESTSSISPGTISVIVGPNTYTDPSMDGTLVGTPAGTGTINYATGDITITGGGAGPLTGTFSYYPHLPVMGLRDFVSNSASTNSKFPLLLAFDTKYSYQVNQAGAVTSQEFFSNTTYYKGTNIPFSWSADDASQFWTINYQSALWATNNKPGLHFLDGTYTSGSGTQVITFNFQSQGNPFTRLIVGDKLWFNEWDQPEAVITDASQTNPVVLQAVNTYAPGDRITISGAKGMTQLNTGIFTISAATGTTITISANGTDWGKYTGGGIATLVDDDTINGFVGTVSNAAGAAAGNYVVTFTEPQTVSGTGIVQMLTNFLENQDGIRWYDGDPTAATGIPTGTGLGWVNFAPPLTATNVAINDMSENKYYLVGALIIQNFKDRLIFFGPQIQAAGGEVFQRPLQDTAIWSWNGTPYYNSLVPTASTINESYDNSAYYVDQIGKGGWKSAGLAQPIVTVIENEDILLVGFGGRGKKTRFIYTSNDLDPFQYYVINSELPSSATFSGLTFDRGGIEIGPYGITITNQQICSRIDLDIPDSVFEIQSANNGTQRVNVIRNFQYEWIYFSYPTGSGNGSSWRFPAQSFMFNYRDNTWGILRENYTTHGYYRKGKRQTWLTLPYKTWADWTVPWNSGSNTQQYPQVIGGNPQGYVLIKDTGTGEGISGHIAAIVDNGMGYTQITSVDHCVNIGDYLYFSNAIGTTTINTKIGMVIETPDANTFVVDILFDGGTYLGLGNFTRLSQPLMQTKMFNPYWEQGKQVCLGPQMYLLDTTSASQATINIYLSQDPNDVWNTGNIIPSPNVDNSSLICSQLVYTCPESTNLGLTPANINLQQQVGDSAQQTWHRMNTSLIGNSFQLGLTLSDAQMRNLTYATSEITLHGIQVKIQPSMMLA